MYFRDSFQYTLKIQLNIDTISESSRLEGQQVRLS